jgi:hypothetical protein
LGLATTGVLPACGGGTDRRYPIDNWRPILDFSSYDYSPPTDWRTPPDRTYPFDNFPVVDRLSVLDYDTEPPDQHVPDDQSVPSDLTTVADAFVPPDDGGDGSAGG